jgi:hypothetical protein
MANISKQKVQEEAKTAGEKKILANINKQKEEAKTAGEKKMANINKEKEGAKSQTAGEKIQELASINKKKEGAKIKKYYIGKSTYYYSECIHLESLSEHIFILHTYPTARPLNSTRSKKKMQQARPLNPRSNTH